MNRKAMDWIDFVFFSSINWDDRDGAHRPTRLARALAQRGHRVLFVQIPPSPSASAAPNVELTSLAELGLSERARARYWFGFDEAGLGSVAENLAARLDAFERGGPRVAIWAAPFIPFVRLLPALLARSYTVVYDCIDDFGGLYALGQYFAGPRAEEFLAARADLITALSQPLVDRLCGLVPGTRVELVPDGADPAFHLQEPVPDDLLRGELTLGFWGTLADHAFDAQTVAYAARARPAWAFNVIGDCDPKQETGLALSALSSLPNVRLLGRRPHAQLMNYLGGLDVCLVPFPNNAFSRGRDPIKVYEYLAGYKPVVALHTPQLAGLPYVSVAHSPEEFVRAIEAASHAPIDRERVDEFLGANSWDARAGRLLALLPPLPRGSRASSAEPPAGQFEEPANVEARTQAYLAHLERTAAERSAHIDRLEQHAREVEAYVHKLERTHPLIWLKRALGK